MISTIFMSLFEFGLGVVVGALAVFLWLSKALTVMTSRLTAAKQLARETLDLEKRRYATPKGAAEPVGAGRVDGTPGGLRVRAAVTRVGRLNSLRSLTERS